jgi:hypothetical protein
MSKFKKGWMIVQLLRDNFEMEQQLRASDSTCEALADDVRVTQSNMLLLQDRLKQAEDKLMASGVLTPDQQEMVDGLMEDQSAANQLSASEPIVPLNGWRDQAAEYDARFDEKPQNYLELDDCR